MEFAAAFAAGAFSSIGPCVAPRFLAIVATADSSRMGRLWKTLAFVAGVCLGYVLIASLAGAVGAIAAVTPQLYAIMGVAFAVFGIVTVVRATRHAHCTHAHVRTLSGGALFLAGCASALVPSPCCMPVVALMATAPIARPHWYVVALVGAFALGHALPLLAAGVGVARLRTLTEEFAQAARTVAGALMLALGAYYAVLV